MFLTKAGWTMEGYQHKGCSWSNASKPASLCGEGPHVRMFGISPVDYLRFLRVHPHGRCHRRYDSLVCFVWLYPFCWSHSEQAKCNCAGCDGCNFSENPGKWSVFELHGSPAATFRARIGRFSSDHHLEANSFHSRGCWFWQMC